MDQSEDNRGSLGLLNTDPGGDQDPECKMHGELLAVVLASDVLRGPVWPATEHHDRALRVITIMERRERGGEGRYPDEDDEVGDTQHPGQ